MAEKKMYIDQIHGITSVALSKWLAWQLICSKCKDMGLQVPTFEQVREKK